MKIDKDAFDKFLNMTMIENKPNLKIKKNSGVPSKKNKKDEDKKNKKSDLNKQNINDT